MRWLKPNLRSISGLLGHASPLAGPALELRTEDVRQAMLGTMIASGIGERLPLLLSRIRYADVITIGQR